MRYSNETFNELIFGSQSPNHEMTDEEFDEILNTGVTTQDETNNLARQYIFGDEPEFNLENELNDFRNRIRYLTYTDSIEEPFINHYTTTDEVFEERTITEIPSESRFPPEAYTNQYHIQDPSSTLITG
jgi:hypothetical protein